jgi:hypothetical protein
MERKAAGGRVARLVVLAAVLSSFCLPAAAQQTAGLRTKFGQVRVRGLKIGQTYSMDELLKLPMRLVNTGSQTVDLVIDTIPVTGATEPGYEPMPGESWVKIDKREFTVDAGHEAVTDLIISIPNDPKLLGRRFEARIWSKTIPKSGQYAAGLISKLLIEVSSVPPTEDELKKKFVDRQIANMDFTLFPTEGIADDVPLGVDFDLKKERKLSIKLVNPNDAALHFRIRPEPVWESLLTVPSAFREPVDFNWVRPSTDTVVVGGNTIKDTALIINIPDDVQYRGQSFFFGIAVEILEQEIPARAYYKLYVKTRREPQTAKKAGK